MRNFAKNNGATIHFTSRSLLNSFSLNSVFTSENKNTFVLGYYKNSNVSKITEKIYFTTKYDLKEWNLPFAKMTWNLHSSLYENDLKIKVRHWNVKIS